MFRRKHSTETTTKTWISVIQRSNVREKERANLLIEVAVKIKTHEIPDTTCNMNYVCRKPKWANKISQIIFQFVLTDERVHKTHEINDMHEFGFLIQCLIRNSLVICWRTKYRYYAGKMAYSSTNQLFSTFLHTNF